MSGCVSRNGNGPLKRRLDLGFVKLTYDEISFYFENKWNLLVMSTKTQQRDACPHPASVQLRAFFFTVTVATVKHK